MSHTPDPFAQADRLRRIEALVVRIAQHLDVVADDEPDEDDDL
jgi:hypothetical protein